MTIVDGVIERINSLSDDLISIKADQSHIANVSLRTIIESVAVIGEHLLKFYDPSVVPEDLKKAVIALNSSL